MSNKLEIIAEYVKYFVWENIYTIFCLIFLYRLHILNQILLAKYSENDVFRLLTHDNNKPIIFFIVTVVLIIIGGIIIVRRIRIIKNEYIEIKELICSIIFIMIVVFLIIALFWAINNPILRAIMAVVFVLCVLSSSK